MKDLRSVKQTAAAIPALSEAAIRWHIFNRKHNGLNDMGVIIKIGRKVMIDIERYMQWLESEPEIIVTKPRSKH